MKKIIIPDNWLGEPIKGAMEKVLKEIEEREKQQNEGKPLSTQTEEITLDKLVVEQKSPRKGNEKELFTYDKSLESIKQRKYERHLRPSESFKLIIDALENPNSQYQQVKEDMLSSYGEWLSLAMLRNKDELICYLDPENIVWNGSSYIIQGNSLKRSGEKTFNIKGISSQNWIDLNKFPSDLVEFLYPRKYEVLPQVMREGSRRAQLYLPQEGIIRPCSRGYNYGNFIVNADVNFRASRAVRERPLGASQTKIFNI